MGERAVNGWLLVGVGWVWCGLGNPQLLLPFIFFRPGFFGWLVVWFSLTLIHYAGFFRALACCSLLLNSTVVQSPKGHSLDSTK